MEKIAKKEGNVNYNPNNIGELYKIDLSKLENLSLNNTADFYIDRQSHTIYYANGVEMNGEFYYTVPLDYQLARTNQIGNSLYCTVEFDSAGGSVVENQKVRTGEKAKMPKAPKKEGHEFLGWYYLENNGTEDEPNYIETEFDFDNLLTQNYSLHANWSGEAVMMARNNNTAFWQESIRTNLKNITFTKDASLIPQNPLETWDVRADKANGATVTAYLQDSENLIVYSPYTIYVNANCYAYFKKFSSLNTIDFSNFNTSKVIAMTSMFNFCSNVTELNLSKFDTSKVINMNSMFNACNSLLTLNVSNFDTSKVTDMTWMFRSCSSLTTLGLDNFRTNKVERMGQMFSNDTSLEKLKINNFDISNVTYMATMFNNCKALKKIDLSSFNFRNEIDTTNMFWACNCVIYVNNIENAKFVHDIKSSATIYFSIF